MKSELLYDRYDTEKMLAEDIKVLIWRYFISCWNNRRICSANGGLPPAMKMQKSECSDFCTFNQRSRADSNRRPSA